MEELLKPGLKQSYKQTLVTPSTCKTAYWNERVIFLSARMCDSVSRYVWHA